MPRTNAIALLLLAAACTPVLPVGPLPAGSSEQIADEIAAQFAPTPAGEDACWTTLRRKAVDYFPGDRTNHLIYSFPAIAHVCDRVSPKDSAPRSAAKLVASLSGRSFRKVQREVKSAGKTNWETLYERDPDLVRRFLAVAG